MAEWGVSTTAGADAGWGSQNVHVQDTQGSGTLGGDTNANPNEFSGNDGIDAPGGYAGDFGGGGVGGACFNCGELG